MSIENAPKKPYREVTLPAILGGVLFGAVLNMGICYAGLQIGFTIVGSTAASVAGYGILRGLLRRGSILEVNIFQSVASTVNIVNAGVIFTLPVLFLMGLEKEIHYPALILGTAGGALLGCAVIIPFRKQIIDLERLRFPEGVAAAAILKSPGAGVHKAVLLVAGIVLSAAVATLTIVPLVPGEGPGAAAHPVLPEKVDLGLLLGLPGAFPLAVALSLLSFGAGFLAGRPGLVILYGTVLNYWVVVPLCLALGWVPDVPNLDEATLLRPPPADAAAYWEGAATFTKAFRDTTSRPVGIGMILGGALAGLVVALPALKAAFGSLRSARASDLGDELSGRTLLLSGLGGLVLFFAAAKLAGGDSVGWGKALAATLIAAAWLWIAGLVVAQTTGRTDWSPLSGLALIAIALLLFLFGPTEASSVVPAVTLGASLCVATSMCADMMADLKTGYLIGALPVRQQAAQLAVCWVGPPIAILTVIILWRAYGFGEKQAEILAVREAKSPGATPAVTELTEAASKAELPDGVPELGAPQAEALRSAIGIVQEGELPVEKYVSGAALGLAVSLLVSPGIGVMIGLSMYLPFANLLAFGIGGLTSMSLSRWKGARFTEDRGVPLAAGFIVGEAVVGVIYAVYKVLSLLGEVAG
jgi:putative OPT family oligopeptide transporter